MHRPPIVFGGEIHARYFLPYRFHDISEVGEDRDEERGNGREEREVRYRRL